MALTRIDEAARIYAAFKGEYPQVFEDEDGAEMVAVGRPNFVVLPPDVSALVGGAQRLDIVRHEFGEDFAGNCGSEALFLVLERGVVSVVCPRCNKIYWAKEKADLHDGDEPDKQERIDA